jgi:hypothetical protein
MLNPNGRILDAPSFGMRRQSEGATALFLAQSFLRLNTKRRRASLAAALHMFWNATQPLSL